MEHYLAQMNQYRSTWPEPDVTLELLRKVLYSFFGVKDRPPSDADVEQKVKGFSQSLQSDGKPSNLGTGMQLTKEETDAYLAAGMPSPFEGWLKGFRNERRRCGSKTDR